MHCALNRALFLCINLRRYARVGATGCLYFFPGCSITACQRISRQHPLTLCLITCLQFQTFSNKAEKKPPIHNLAMTASRAPDNLKGFSPANSGQ